MAIPTGLAAQLGVVTETTYGTPVTVTRFYELVDESMKMEIERMESKGLRAGTRVLRSDRWVAGRKTAAGDVNLELANKSFGLLFTHMLGGAAVTTSATGVYTHTFTPSDLPVSATVQVGRPNNAGTVQPFTYHGCRIASWEIAAQVGEIGKLKLSLVAEDEDTSTSLASASYPASLTLLTFKEATLTIAGSAVPVTSATLRGDNGLAADRHRLGSQLTKQPLEAAVRVYDGELDADFESTTAYGRFIAGTEAALVLAFEGATITTGYTYLAQFTCNVRFDGATPNVSGPEELRQPLRFKCLDSGAGASTALTLVYRTSDATA
jgi:hypothetical protein